MALAARDKFYAHFKAAYARTCKASLIIPLSTNYNKKLET